MKPKQHRIKIGAAILNLLNEDNVENFITGYAEALRFYVKVVGIAKSMSPENSYRKNTDLVKERSFIYIDDGKQENEKIIYLG